MKVLFKLILPISLVLFFSCGGGDYTPSGVPVSISILDKTQNPISGIECILTRNGIELDKGLTNVEGKCGLKTEIGHDDKYMLYDEFYSELLLKISDPNGVYNKGETLEYQIEDYDWHNGVIIILK